MKRIIISLFIASLMIGRSVFYVSHGGTIHFDIMHSIASEPTPKIGKCNEPLNMVVYVTPHKYYTPIVTDAILNDLVKKAENEWETKTGIDMFNILPENSDSISYRDANPIVLKDRDTSRFTVGQEELEGQTNVEKTDSNIVVHARIDLYEDNPVLLYQIILHEMGHARGLMIHSDNPDDIMYKYTNTTIHLTPNDVKMMLDYCNSI